MPFLNLFKRSVKASSGPISWAVAGLGNPGPKYENTRHNAGFNALDLLASKEGSRVDRMKFKSLTGEITVGGERVLLIKPQTFMNNSGQPISEALRFYKIPPERLIVVFDDVSLPCGRLRVRPKGSDGGHNGIKSIIHHLRSDGFPRVKIGVGSPPRADYDMVDWVLGQVASQDCEDYQNALERAGQAACAIIEHGADEAMGTYNKK